ncbi:thioester reductase domain-containing protein [Staphylococcus roterodami]|nr:thioester reductase domain-containing protein [Staphylococcus roterodami]
MSYETLQHYVNKIARILTSKGIVRGQRIALLAERSFEMIAAMLAAVKVGASYVPIDTDCPKKRRETILEDAQIVAVMTYGVDINTTLPVIDLENVKCQHQPSENDYSDRVSCDQDYEICTEGDDNQDRLKGTNQYGRTSDEVRDNQYSHNSEGIRDNQGEEAPDVQDCKVTDNHSCGEMMLDNEMYVIYTSGTTGVPKGVAVSQRNLLNLVYAWSHELQLQDAEVFLQHANIIFDASVMEIYCCLLNGHTLVISNKAQRVDPEQLQQLITKHHITVASIPLQMCSMMGDFYIEKLITGGATSTPSFVNYIEHHCSTYYNAYGPSESTVITSYWSHQCADKVPETIPIGKPLSNIQVYIMSDGLLCGVGMPGELCVAGDSLALGYINRPELTADKWQDNPFGKGKLYHSGDLARYTPDGQIEFLGRIDKQVKVNGYRIELDEIENTMLAIHGVSDCVVTVKHFDTHDILNAYYVGQPNIEQDVKHHLLEHLPKYMVPKTVTHINHMPLTANDKVDKSQLPEPSILQQNGKTDSEAANETEQTFINVFETVLKQNHIGVDDDFFELGGNSLEAMLVVSRLKALGRHLSMQTLYQYKTVKRIVKYMHQCQQVEVTLPKDYSELQQMVESHYCMGVFEHSMERGTLGNVLLTGATGFLGAYLIEALQGYNNRIYCFIRADDNDDARDKLLTNLNYYFSEETVEKMLSNIEVIVGDLEHMNEVSLTETIDTIIHAGARTNHFGDDTEFEKVNVQGTIDVIHMARQHQAKLIYISTISVGTYFDVATEEITFSEADVYKGQLLTSPYTRSKFYSEIKVLEAVKDGLDGRIIRVGNLTSPYKGRWNMRNIKTNRFSIVMNDLLQLDCLSDGLAETPVDLSFVDTTARQIVALAKLNMSLIIYHVLSPHKMTMKSLLENVKCKEINIVSDRHFEQMLHKHQMYETIGLTSVDIGQQLATIDAEKTLSIMKDIGEQWPTMTSDWLCHWAQYIQTIFNK